jgi:hypothetical protein
MRCFRCNVKFKSTNAPSRQPAGRKKGKNYCQECWYSLHGTIFDEATYPPDVDGYLNDWRAFHEYRESL